MNWGRCELCGYAMDDDHQQCALAIVRVIAVLCALRVLIEVVK